MFVKTMCLSGSVNSLIEILENDLFMYVTQEYSETIWFD